MRAIKGKMTISRGHSAEGSCIAIEVVDRSSGVLVFNGSMELSTFANMITGLGAQDIDLRLPDHCHPAVLGLKKEILRKVTPLPEGVRGYDERGREDLLALIDQELMEMGDGWELWSDGLNVQQNTRGHHCWTACRWVEEGA